MYVSGDQMLKMFIRTRKNIQVVPCGIEGKTVTSLSQELQQNVTIDDTIEPLLTAFSHVFEEKTILQSETNETVDFLHIINEHK